MLQERAWNGALNLWRHIGPTGSLCRFGEELVYLVVEVVGVFAQGAVARVRDNPEVGVGNVLVDKDGMGNGDEVVVATDDERRGLDRAELREGDVGLLPVEEEELAVVFSRAVE